MSRISGASGGVPQDQGLGGPAPSQDAAAAQGPQSVDDAAIGGPANVGAAGGAQAGVLIGTKEPEGMTASVVGKPVIGDGIGAAAGAGQADGQIADRVGNQMDETVGDGKVRGYAEGKVDTRRSGSDNKSPTVHDGAEGKVGKPKNPPGTVEA